MPLHTELSVDIQGFGDTTKLNCAFAQKFDSLILDTLVEESSGRLVLAAGATDVDVNFQSLAAGQLVLLKSVAEFSFKLNGAGNPATTLKPQTNTSTSVVTPAFLAMLSNGITSIHLTNPDGANTIEVDFAIAGAA